MSVAKIALGVFLGNLMFGVVAWVGFAAMSANEGRNAADQARAQYQSLEANY